MGNNLFDVFYFAEFILTIGSLIILIIALFLKKNVFERTALLSILLLLVVSFAVIAGAVNDNFSAIICDIAAFNSDFNCSAVFASIAFFVPPATAILLKFLKPEDEIPVPNATAKVFILCCVYKLFTLFSAQL